MLQYLACEYSSSYGSIVQVLVKSPQKFFYSRATAKTPRSKLNEILEHRYMHKLLGRATYEVCSTYFAALSRMVLRLY